MLVLRFNLNGGTLTIRVASDRSERVCQPFSCGTTQQIVPAAQIEIILDISTTSCARALFRIRECPFPRVSQFRQGFSVPCSADVIMLDDLSPPNS